MWKTYNSAWLVKCPNGSYKLKKVVGYDDDL